ncbi:MAG: hypothetical protein IJ458_00910 [Clostridia bacterium]|nr:hypothetical protein [Clostridia bacterium]
MIVDKEIALKEIIKPNVNFNEFDKCLLSDKDIVLNYIQHHSSNDILFRDFPISIDNSGMIDDVDFIAIVINNLDVDYSKKHLKDMLKYSTSLIVKNKMRGDECDAEELKSFAKTVLLKYNDMVKVRNEQLAKKQRVLDDISECIDNVLLDAFDTKPNSNKKNMYKRCNIGFTAEIK